jgi:hypothetical protein
MPNRGVDYSHHDIEGGPHGDAPIDVAGMKHNAREGAEEVNVNQTASADEIVAELPSRIVADQIF